MLTDDEQQTPEVTPEPQVPRRGLRSSVGDWIAGLRGSATRHVLARARNNGLVVDTELLKKLDRLSLSVGNDLIGGLMGEHIAVRKTLGIEFSDFRPYSVGDDLRRVDWNAYARLGTLHVRQAQAEHETTLYMLVDASPSMEFGMPSKFLTARRLAASFGYIALAHLDAGVMATPGAPQAGENGEVVSFRRFRGRAESGEMFRILQNLRTLAAPGFNATLGTWVQESAGRGRGRIAVVVSDLLLDGWRNGVKALVAAGFAVTMLHVVSREELDPVEKGNLELLDSETGERLEMYLGKEGLAEYERRLHEWLAETEDWCRTQGTGYLRVMNDWDVERVMLETLRRRGVVV
ncbi:MAG TPA: DUF58 domain-containing protein [Chloroflexia bacterium]|nr:DUF58 domain-containing protein [Chloroflexia bacterium]